MKSQGLEIERVLTPEAREFAVSGSINLTEADALFMDHVNPEFRRLVLHAADVVGHQVRLRTVRLPEPWPFSGSQHKELKMLNERDGFKPEVPTMNPWTLEALESWLEGQDPATTYDWMSHTDCLFARYAKHVCGDGVASPFMNAVVHFGIELIGNVASDRHGKFATNYGAALDRLRIIMDEQLFG